MPKFDYIIQNPPYKYGTHLDFFNLSLDILSDTGKLIIIEPATWLIDIRKTSRNFLKYEKIKNNVKQHIKSVYIENLNREFNIGLAVPCAVTVIDMSDIYNKIDFVCCGEHKQVKSIYDCNLIGDYNIVTSILNKCLNYNNRMIHHIYNKNTVTDENTYYTKYGYILSVIGCIFSAIHNGNTYESDNSFKHHKCGEYMSGYISALYHINYNEITNHVIKAVKSGSTCGTPGKNDADCLYGTKQELENWKYYVYNNKLPLFLSIILNYDMRSKSREYIPWLTDKIYTDEEIYNILDITAEEQKLIDITLYKFERYSPWFKRYSNGK